MKSHPASSTTSLSLESFANSPAVAATLAQEEEEGIWEAWVVLRTDKLKYAGQPSLKQDDKHHQGKDFLVDIVYQALCQSHPGVLEE